MKLSIFFLSLLAAARALAPDSSAAQQTQGQERALDITTGLYLTMRNIAYPDHKINDDKNVDSRFLLLMPGKVLNYFDYYPGTEYTNFIQNPNANTPEAVVPPHVMEKWFDLADSIPNYNPLNAQDTGKGLAEVYSSILHETKLLGLDSKTASEKAILTQAISYLNELVVDPENVTAKAPRLALYERYRDLYNDRKLEMEDLIDQKRRSVNYLDYELWFQRHYPSLQAKVESAYTRWLVFGEKEKIELYITYMDTGSAARQLEEARIALRVSGVNSLDRTRTIYPVSFEPSDWYKYLLPEAQHLSQDQLWLMYGKLQGKINGIDAMTTALQANNDSISQSVETLKTYKRNLDGDVNRNVSEFMRTQINCLGHLNTQQTCSNYDEQRESAIIAIMEEAEALSTYQYGNYFSDPQMFTKYLTQEKGRLQNQLGKIEAQLGISSPFLGGILDANQLAVANLSDSNRDNQWLQFDYDHRSFFRDENREKTSQSIQASFSVHFLFFHLGGGSYSYNKNTDDFAQKLASSNMRVKGELLRVNIKRPWFKPDLFDVPDFTFSESQDGVRSFVSPGREFTETSFYTELSQNTKQYKLPEYTTGFLLARKIEMEFTNLDSATVTSAMNEMSHKSGGGGFLFFRAQASETKTKQTSHTNVQRTANGMKISIPGAQLVGYYTQVLPRFPVNQ